MGRSGRDSRMSQAHSSMTPSLKAINLTLTTFPGEKMTVVQPPPNIVQPLLLELAF